MWRALIWKLWPWRRQIYYGTAGEKAHTPLCKALARLDEAGVTFGVRFQESDSGFISLLVSANASPPVGIAIRCGSFDADCWIEYSCGGPIQDGEIVWFECYQTENYGRQPRGGVRVNIKPTQWQRLWYRWLLGFAWQHAPLIGESNEQT